MQQINLYHSRLRKKERVFSFNRVVQAAAALLALIFIVQASGFYQTYSLQADTTIATKLLADKKQRLQTLQASLPKIKKNAQLATTYKNLEQDLLNKQTVLNVLSEKKLGNTNGFSEHFEGLARQSKAGLWLTRLHFLQGGTVLDIEGHSNKPELLPQYLQALSSEEIFKGTEFNSFVIRRENNNKPLHFKINNVEKLDKLASTNELSSQ